MKRKTPIPEAKANRHVLNLTLHREFFDAIAEGSKKREYREDKPYWRTRLVGRHYTEIRFRNGYLPGAPLMRVKCLGISKRAGRFVISLGNIVELKNYER
jgi:hypothetical protein